MFHRKDGIIYVLKDGGTSIDQMGDLMTNLAILVCPINDDIKHVGNNVEQNQRHGIPLSQTFPRLKIMTNVIINFNVDGANIFIQSVCRMKDHFTLSYAFSKSIRSSFFVWSSWMVSCMTTTPSKMCRQGMKAIWVGHITLCAMSVIWLVPALVKNILKHQAPFIINILDFFMKLRGKPTLPFLWREQWGCHSLLGKAVWCPQC